MLLGQMMFLGSPLLIPVVAIGGVFLWLIIMAIVSGVQSIVRHRNEVELKQMLVDRGMSADEIVRIVEASGAKESEEA